MAPRTATITAPVTTRFIGSEAPICTRPASSVAMMSTPMKLLTMLPRPPIRLVPPTTTAAMALSSVSVIGNALRLRTVKL